MNAIFFFMSYFPISLLYQVFDLQKLAKFSPKRTRTECQVLFTTDSMKLRVVDQYFIRALIMPVFRLYSS